MASLERLNEHYGYLADQRRMQALRKAISATVHPGDHVIDLGCGTGILGLYSLEAGAGHVTFIDQTDMIEVARNTMLQAGYIDRCTFHQGRSHHIALSEPADVIVCDNIGYFGIDYDLLETFRDAADRFLAPGGRLIPDRLRLFVGLVDLGDSPNPVERWVGEDIPKEFHWLAGFNSNLKLPTSATEGMLLSTSVQVAEFRLGQDAPSFANWKASVLASRNGRAHGVAGWFEADLAVGCSMSNAPDLEGRISRPIALLPFEEPLELTEGNTVEVSIMTRPNDHVWAWRVQANGGAEKRSQTTLNALSPATMKAQTGSAGLTVQLTDRAKFRKIVFDYCDGEHSASQIEELIVAKHADLFPTETALRAQIAAVLSSYTVSGKP